MADNALAELAPEPTATKAPPLWESPEIGGTPKPAAEAPETPVETPETPKAPEILDEPKKPQNPQGGEPEVPLKGKARENFARLEQKAKESEEARAKLQAEYDAAQARLKEHEEKLEKLSAHNPDEFARKEQEYQTKLAELQNELKFVALEKDPDFIARYETPKVELQGVMKQMALAAGVDEKEFDASVGNPRKMFELRDNLEPHDQYRWDAALSQIEQVNLGRTMALKNRDQTYQEINQRREQQWTAQRNEVTNKNIQTARSITAEMLEKVPVFKDDPELQKSVESTLEAIAGGKGAEDWDAAKIMRQVAASVAQTKILSTQHEIIQGQTSEIEELKKKVEQQESFIKEKFGSLPDTKPSVDGKKEPEKPRPIWEVAQEAATGATGGREFI